MVDDGDEPEWKVWVTHNEHKRFVKAFVDETRPLEKSEPENAISRYREAIEMIEEYEQATVAKLGKHPWVGFADQSAIKRLAMILRRLKRYEELIEAVEHFHAIFPGTAINENQLKRWLREAREKTGKTVEQTGYQETLEEAGSLASEIASRPGKTYPVPIVGEKFRQDAIRKCSAGEGVTLLREPGNPHDPDAIAVEDMRGATIGYIPRSSFVHRAVHREDKELSAKILRISGGAGGPLGVTLDITFEGEKVGERAFRR